mmetsp:Transcript_18871/g.52453  ORF Transcript_18871/g.52453 Transcript_18871/m.52453 type:complete len:274 (+) Transcript_18871:788-1609(+)
MSPRHELQVVDLVEFIRDALTEQVPGSSGRDVPAGGERQVLGIRPHQIAEGALMRDLLVPVDGTDLIQRAYVGGQTAVHAQDLLIDEGGKAEAIEALYAVSPHARVAVLAQAFIVKAVHLRNLSRLVISAEKRDVGRVLELEAEQQAERLHGIVTPIDEVAQEDVGRLRRPTPDLVEHVQQVEELAVQIAHHLDWRNHRLHVRFLHQQLRNILAQVLQLSLRHAFALPQSLDARVHVDEACHFVLCSILRCLVLLVACALCFNLHVSLFVVQI